MLQPGFPGKQTLRLQLVCKYFVIKHSWDKHLWKETGLGRRRHWAAMLFQERPHLTLLKLGWSLSVVLWSEGAATFTSKMTSHGLQAVLGRGMTLALAIVFSGGNLLRRLRTGGCVSAAIATTQGNKPLRSEEVFGQHTPPLHHSCPLINGNSSGLFLKVNSKEEGQWTSHSPCCSKTIFIVSFLYNLLKILSPKALAFVHLSSSHLLWHRFSSLRGLYPSWAVAAALSIKTEQKTNKKDISEWPPCQSYSSLPPLWNQIKMSMGKSEEATIPELGGIFVDLLRTCVFLFSEYESSEY